MESYKVSIIVPVYNVERYLRQCMDSLTGQTLDEIEIIAVNDGSPDNSLSILQEYEKNYPEKVKVFSIENQGVGHARNYGFSKASGEYVLFVDSDDYLEENTCEILYEKAKRDGNDLVLFGRYNEENGVSKENISLPWNDNFRLIDQKYALTRTPPFPWDKFIKRELFDKVGGFPEKIRFEDLPVACMLAVCADSIGTMRTCLYHYRVQVGFLSTLTEETMNIITSLELLMRSLKERGVLDTYRDEMEYVAVRHCYYRFITLKKFHEKGKLDLQVRLVNEVFDFLEREFPNWRENRYVKYSTTVEMGEFLDVCDTRKKLLKFVRQTDGQSEGAKNKWLEKHEHKKEIRDLWSGFWRSKAKIAYLGDVAQKLKKMKPKIKRKLHWSVLAGRYYTVCVLRNPVSENTILLESKHGEDLAGNIFQILKVLKEEKYKTYAVYLSMKEEYIPKYKELLLRYNMTHIMFVKTGSKTYKRLLATAKYLATDTSFPTYYVKREAQVYLNTWHGTPLKGMGRIVPNREYGLGNVQRNFFIADYLLYQQEFSRDIFQRDYMLKDIYPGKILTCGYPRNVAFFNTKRYEQIRKEMGLEGKQVIVYMPTWRGLLYKKENAKQIQILTKYLADLDNLLKKNQVFYVKLHPYVKEGINLEGFIHIKEFPSQYETYDFLNASDALVTDYSSIMFDYAVANKKIVLFVYDKDEYLKDRGMYVNLDELGLPQARSVKRLQKILTDPQYDISAFRERFCSYDSPDTAKKVCETWIGGKNTLPVETVKNNGKEKVLVFTQRAVDTALVEEMNEQVAKDSEIREYYLTFPASVMKKNSSVLSKLDKRINYFPIDLRAGYTLAEFIASHFVFRYDIQNSGMLVRLTRRLSEREYQRIYGSYEFDKLVILSCRSRRLYWIARYTSEHRILCLGRDKGMYDSVKNFRMQVDYLIKHRADFEKIVLSKELAKKKKLTKDSKVTVAGEKASFGDIWKEGEN